MSYMSQLPSAKERSQVYELSVDHSFLEYASTYVFDHAEEAQRKGIKQNKFLQSLKQQYENFQRLQHIYNSFERNSYFRYYESATILYSLSFHGYRELVKALLSEGQVDINTRGEHYNSTLQATTLNRDKEIVGMLLNKGAGVNIQGGLHDSALQAAVSKGGTKIVEMLLGKEADVNIQGGLYGGALQAAVNKGRIHQYLSKPILDCGCRCLAIPGGKSMLDWQLTLFSFAITGSK